MPVAASASPARTIENFAHLAHVANAAPIVMVGLQSYDRFEHTHQETRAIKSCVLSLGAGFAFAVFPFTPGAVSACNPEHNPGWLCGARIAAFLSCCEASLVAVCSALSLWRGRNAAALEAARLGVEIGRQIAGSSGEWPAEMMSAYHKADELKRDKLKIYLSAFSETAADLRLSEGQSDF